MFSQSADTGFCNFLDEAFLLVVVTSKKAKKLSRNFKKRGFSLLPIACTVDIDLKKKKKRTNLKKEIENSERAQTSITLRL